MQRPPLNIDPSKAKLPIRVLFPTRRSKKPKKPGDRRNPPEPHRFKPGNNANPWGRKGKAGECGLTRRQTLLEARRKALAEHGLTPLEFLLSVVRDPTAHMDYRIDAAKAASPYVHRKMPIAIEGGDPNKPVVFEAQLLAVLSPQEKMLLLGLIEKMTLPAGGPKALIESVARRESDADDKESTGG